MAFEITYKPLFSVDILHKYFLNDGVREYQQMTGSEKQKQLEKYDTGLFFDILPAAETMQKINGHNLVFKLQRKGYTVWCKVSEDDENKPFITLDDDLCFTFLIRIKDKLFFNYTLLPLDTSGKLFLFSNRKPALPAVFPLIELTNTFSVIDQSYVLPDDEAKKYLSGLSVKEKENLFGIVKIYVKGDTTDLNITNTQGEIEEPERKFEVFLGNRVSYWRYIFRKSKSAAPTDDLLPDGSSDLRFITKDELPLTKSGFVSVKLGGADLPNPDAGTILPDEKIINKYYSEIYM